MKLAELFQRLFLILIVQRAEVRLPGAGMRHAVRLLALILLSLYAAACSANGSPPEKSTAPSPLVHFEDVTAEAGLDFQHGAFRWGLSGDPVAMMGGGLCWLDYDRDGWLDLYAVNSYALAEAGRWEAEGGLPRNALYRNDGGRFVDVSAASGTGLALRGNGCVAADLDLDGWTDLYITTARFNALLWNNGDGTFTEGAQDAGVDAYGWQTGAAVGDLNADGWPDLFVAGYVDLNNRKPEATMGFPNTHYGRPDLLYLNQGPSATGRAAFREAGAIAGLETRDFEYGLGALLSDFDGDGDLDLLVANDTNPNRLYENIPWPGGVAADPEGLGFRFAEVGQYARVGDRNSGMGVASGDYNLDGRLDLVITNLGQQRHSVYLNQSAHDRLAFLDATHNMGVVDIGVGWTGWGISWADVDLDTDLDLIVANGAVPVMDPAADAQPIQFFTNLTAQGLDGLFQDLTGQAGFDQVPPLIARGSAIADYDNDGDLDLAVSSLMGKLLLLRNDQSGGHWLTVRLEDSLPGALVTAVLPDGRRLLCETHAGSSYLSSEDPRCHFGLGAAGRAAELQVRWPNGAISRMKNVAAGRFVAVNARSASAPAAPSASTQDLEEFLFQLSLQKGGAEPMVMIPPGSPEMIRLGEALFWDRELSGNRDIACATCHHPVAASGDALSVSIGTGGSGLARERQLGPGRPLIPRNASEIFNRGVEGWHTIFWDGRVSGTSEAGFVSPAGEALPDGLANAIAVQAMFPVTSRDEMRGQPGDVDVFGRPNELALIPDNDLPAIWAGLMARLLAIPEYRRLFAAAYPDVRPDWLRFQHAANAIAAYEMNAFTFTDSPWDRYLAGDPEALPPDAKRGASLFYGEAGCSQCHNGSLLTDQQFHNICVPQVGPGKGDEAPSDFGRGRETGIPGEMFAFRTPPLRNVALTGPWMHDGAYTTLEGAVRHHLDPVSALARYDVTQLDAAVMETYAPQQEVLVSLDPLMEEPVVLSGQEFNELMTFLYALTSPTAFDGCKLIPESVPSGLPVDAAPEGRCAPTP